MAGQINAITFETMRGRPVPPATAIEAFERHGVDGAELREVGLREKTVTLMTTQTALDAAAALTAVAALEALIGTIVTIQDDQGATHANVLVVNADAQVRAVLSPTSNPTHTRLIETTWTVRERYNPPA